MRVQVIIKGYTCFLVRNYCFCSVMAGLMAFRLIDRRNRAQNANEDDTGEERADSFVELTECEGCGAYVTAAGCDNPDCPVNG